MNSPVKSLSLDSIDDKYSKGILPCEIDEYHHELMIRNPYYTGANQIKLFFALTIPKYLANSIKDLYSFRNLDQSYREDHITPNNFYIPDNFPNDCHKSTIYQYKKELIAECNRGYRQYRAFKESKVSEELSRIFLRDNHFIEYYYIDNFTHCLESALLMYKSRNRELVEIGEFILNELNLRLPKITKYRISRIL